VGGSVRRRSVGGLEMARVVGACVEEEKSEGGSLIYLGGEGREEQGDREGVCSVEKDGGVGASVAGGGLREEKVGRFWRGDVKKYKWVCVCMWKEEEHKEGEGDRSVRGTSGVKCMNM